MYWIFISGPPGAIVNTHGYAQYPIDGMHYYNPVCFDLTLKFLLEVIKSTLPHFSDGSDVVLVIDD